ncbi:hypothetical protein BHM03_00039428 [Ensete ventricosum]|nr:hypothetical protein BHM03_00039428 [Ensete ventricosum]
MTVSPETTARSLVSLFLLAAIASTVAANDGGSVRGVTYDSRSLIINGKRELLFSGSVHYPRSTPERLMVVCVHAAPYGKIENEYNNVARAFEGGSKYIQWAGNMAVGLDAGVPWVMCKQNDAPGPVVWYRVFGDPPSQRSAEDIAYSVARFFSKNGTLTNYYMVWRTVASPRE